MMRKSKFILLACLWLAAPLPVLCQLPPDYALPIREHIFANGLRLLVLHRPGDHRVACKIFTDFGALVETPGELGAAHFLEHLMFKGTPTLGTTSWQAEKPLIDSINVAEQRLIEALNQARNALRERGVFHDYRHRDSTPEIDSVRAVLQNLHRQAAVYRDNGAMMRWYQGFGGSHLTASTEQEYMKFDINLPASRVALFLRIEADRMHNTVFREFDQERMILLEQRYGDMNRPPTPFYEAMNALVQTVHPVYWPEGYLTDFSQYTRRAERRLYERYFIPNNSTLVFVGGVTLEQMIPLVAHYFDWMPRQPEPMRVKAIEPVPQAEKLLVWRSRTLSPRIDVRFMIPAIGHPDRPAFDVLAEVLGPEIRAALQGAAISGRVNVNTRVVHTSRFGVPATLNLEVADLAVADLAPCREVVLQVVQRLGETGCRERDIALAKKRLRAQWFRTAQSADRLAFEIGHFQIMDSWHTLARHLAAREKTTPADLRRLAQKYFIPENRAIGIVQPPEPGVHRKEVAK